MRLPHGDDREGHAPIVLWLLADDCGRSSPLQDDSWHSTDDRQRVGIGLLVCPNMSGRFRHDALNSRTVSGQDRAYPQAPLPVRAIVEELASIESSWESVFRLFFCYRIPSSLDVVAVATMRDAVAEGLLSISVEFVDHSPEPMGEFVQRGLGRRPSESA